MCSNVRCSFGGGVLSTNELRLKLSLLIDSSSSVCVLGGSKVQDEGASAWLSLDSFATIFGHHAASKLALILHAEAFRRTVQARSCERAAGPSHRHRDTCSSDTGPAEPPLLPSDQRTDDAAADINADIPPDVNHFFIFQGSNTRRVLSAPATQRPQQSGAYSQEVDSSNATRLQSEDSMLPGVRCVSARVRKRSHSAGLPTCHRATKLAPATESRFVAKEMRFPEFLKHSKLHDSDSRSRSAKLIEQMASRVPGPITADASQPALITDEIRLEVATAWGVPALFGVSNMHAEVKENTGEHC
jgi:hypothetical protein